MMTPIRFVMLLVVLAALAAPLAVFAQQPAPAQGDFVPVKDVPVVEQIPAAPMVMAAYGILWAVILIYVWTIWRRLRKAELEIAELNRRLKER